MTLKLTYLLINNACGGRHLGRKPALRDMTDAQWKAYATSCARFAEQGYVAVLQMQEKTGNETRRGYMIDVFCAKTGDGDHTGLHMEWALESAESPVQVFADTLKEKLAANLPRFEALMNTFARNSVEADDPAFEELRFLTTRIAGEIKLPAMRSGARRLAALV